jgi:ABC-2 type transport system ATP-binding protein
MSLIIDSVSKNFGDVHALDDVSLEIEPGEVFGFLGANGAGKTTAMRIVLDILRPDSGSVSWNGRPNTEVSRATWGYLPEERGLYARMTVVDQLVFFAKLHGVAPRKAERETRDWLDRFRIPEYADRRAEQLSKGNQQKIQFIAAILHDPLVLLMDEPFTGLDPVNAALLKEAFQEMKDRGKTMVFSTHQMDTVEELCESIAILDRGRVVVGGTVRDVRRATGRQVVRLAVEGDSQIDWLDGLDGFVSRGAARTTSRRTSRRARTRASSCRPPWRGTAGSASSRSPTLRSSRSSSNTSASSTRPSERSLPAR